MAGIRGNNQRRGGDRVIIIAGIVYLICLGSLVALYALNGG